MIFFGIYVCLFCLVLFLSFMDKEKDKYVVGAYIAIAVVLVLMVGLRPIGLDKDSGEYEKFYYVGDLLVEPSFNIISDIAQKWLGGLRGVLIIYAVLSIPLMAYAVSRSTKLWFLSIGVWMSHFFLLQNTTQIRVAVATGIFILALQFLIEKKRLAYALMIGVAIFFHYSAIVLLPLAFLGCDELSERWKMVLVVMPLAAYVVSPSNIGWLSAIPIPGIQDKLEIYEEMRDSGVMNMDQINRFNIVSLLKLAMYYFLLWKYDLIKRHFPQMALFLKIYAFSIISFAMLAFLPVLAFRVSEIFGVVEIILFPYIIYAIRPRIAGQILLLLFATAILAMDILYNQLLNLNV